MNVASDPVHIYALQLESGMVPMDIIDALAHSAWGVLRQEFGINAPYRWLKLHQTLRGIFKARVKLYRGCGGTACLARQSPAIFVHHEETPSPRNAGVTVVYLLETRQSAEGFVKSLADLALRQAQDYLRRAPEKKQLISDRIFLAIRNTLARHLYVNERCAACAVRVEGKGDRRFWGDAESAWR